MKDVDEPVMADSEGSWKEIVKRRASIKPTAMVDTTNVKETDIFY